MDPPVRLTHATYTVRKNLFNFYAPGFHIYDHDGGLILYSKAKTFTLKEDIRFYTQGGGLATEVIRIRADQIINFPSSYTIKDTINGDTIGVLKRAEIKSMIRDEWILFTANSNKIGKIMEDSTFNTLGPFLRQLVSVFSPLKYHMEISGQTICTMHQNFNPFVMKLTVDFTPDTDKQLDPRLGLAAAILICVIACKQY